MIARIFERLYAWWGARSDVKIERSWQYQFGACVRLDTLGTLMEKRGWACSRLYDHDIPTLRLHNADGALWVAAAKIDRRGWHYNVLSGDGQPTYIYVPCTPIRRAIQTLELFVALSSDDGPGPWRPQ
ncbi:hypothetical protein SMC26_01520 [Actinomadura fulvescens]|uniref:Uncharacterized protein n=1 Tax=Actinomadura fulvescens TaxID=46160 RepID=A0ABN3QCT6_9ACTN